MKRFFSIKNIFSSILSYFLLSVLSPPVNYTYEGIWI